jgi:hypothetical protein
MNRIFLSYARDDDEPFVKQLYAALVSDSFEVWWDRQSMPSRALTFLHEIRNAVDDCERLVVVVGPVAVTSEYVKAEWQYALAKDKVVVPVLRCGEYELLPPELARFHCPDVRPSRPAPEALAEVSRVLRGPLPSLGRVHHVPQPPPRFQPRTDQFSRLSSRILCDLEDAAVVEDGDRTTVLYGMGGVGKSVLAGAFARATSTRRFFVDGVFWLDLRRTSSVTAALDALGRTIASKAWIDDDRPAEDRLHDLLADSTRLIILDNIEREEQVAPFIRSLGRSPTRLLITTREGELATGLGANEIRLDELDRDAALRHLADWTNANAADLPPIVGDVAKACGYLPFALSLCGALAAEGLSWADVAESLRIADQEYLEKKFPNYPYPNVLRCLEASAQALERADGRGARCFRSLVVFQKGDKVPEQAVVTLWRQSEKLKDLYARKLLVQLERKSLLRLEGDQPNRLVYVHDLQYDYLSHLEGDASGLHETLLDGYRELARGDWVEGPDDGYFLQRLAYHLAQAGQLDELERLVLDLRWVSRRIVTSGPVPAIADYEFLPDSAEAGMVKDALRLSAPVLARDPGQLDAQLAGRLPADLAKRLLRVPAKFELRPIRASLSHVGGPASALIQAAGRVAALVAHPHGELLLTASEGGSLEVWDRKRGSRTAAFQGAGREPTCIAVAQDARLALVGYKDAPIEVWDLASNQLLKSVPVNDVTAIAVNPSGRRAAVSTSNATFGLDLDADRKLEAAPGKSTAVGITADGSRGVSVRGGAEAVMTVWDVETGREVMRQRLDEVDRYVMAAAIGSDAKYAVAACRRMISPVEDYPMCLDPCLWDVEAGKPCGSGPTHRDLIQAVAVSTDGRRGMSSDVRGQLSGTAPGQRPRPKRVSRFGTSSARQTHSFRRTERASPVLPSHLTRHVPSLSQPSRARWSGMRTPANLPRS